MSRIALASSFVAVALSSWAAWTASHGASHEVSERLDRLDARIDELLVLETRMGNVEARAANAGPTPPRPVDAPRPLARVDDAPTAAPSADAATRAAVDTTVADLVKRVAAIEQKAKAEETAEPKGLVRALRSARGAFGPANVYGSIDDAQEDLDLSSSQRGDFERTIADAKRDLEELHKIPDEDGKTWEQAEQETLKGLSDGSMRFDFGKMLAFRGKKIPGRSETYGDADQRIRADAKRRMRDTLSTDQQKKFEKAMIEPMLGMGAGPQMSVTVVGSDDLDDAGMK